MITTESIGYPSTLIPPTQLCSLPPIPTSFPKTILSLGPAFRLLITGPFLRGCSAVGLPPLSWAEGSKSDKAMNFYQSFTFCPPSVIPLSSIWSLDEDRANTGNEVTTLTSLRHAASSSCLKLSLLSRHLPDFVFWGFSSIFPLIFLAVPLSFQFLAKFLFITQFTPSPKILTHFMCCLLGKKIKGFCLHQFKFSPNKKNQGIYASNYLPHYVAL